ncbi:MAG: hypothetical protein QMD53_07205, partial [Actinomycetota bacterium]|nr:hypothetical protein [Actinomycetota bacterium]
KIDIGKSRTILVLTQISLYAANVSIESSDPKPVETYREMLNGYKDLAHINIEVLKKGESKRGLLAPF